MRFRERIDFLSQARRRSLATGAIQPSSRYLANAMTAPLRKRPPPRRIIEMGPGTGSITRAIAAAMTRDDRLDCYEINARFAQLLAARIQERAEYRPVADRIFVHHAPAQQASSDELVDFVLCSVPLNNLPGEIAADIFDRGFDLLAPGGWFTYFEYPLLPRVRRLFASAAEKQRIDSVRAEKQSRHSPRSTSTLVLRNVPPARAVHLLKPSADRGEDLD